MWIVERLNELAKVLAIEDIPSILLSDLEIYRKTLSSVHYRPDTKLYFDIGPNLVLGKNKARNHYRMDHFQHIGYITIFPLLLEIESHDADALGKLD